MKRIVFLFLVLFLVSCGGDDENVIKKSPTEPEKSLLIGEWVEVKYELISGEDGQTILESKTVYTDCEKKSSTEFTAHKKFIVKKYEEDSSTGACDDVKITNSKFNYDKEKNVVLINQMDEFIIINLSETNLGIEKLYKDVNGDGYVEFYRKYFVRK